jgi:hypothetical protein
LSLLNDDVEVEVVTQQANGFSVLITGEFNING